MGNWTVKGSVTGNISEFYFQVICIIMYLCIHFYGLDNLWKCEFNGKF